MRLKKMASVEALFVTASMTKATEDIGAEELALIHRRMGYTQIAAHFVIRRNGQIETGRPLDLPGALGNASTNSKSLQVVLVGGLSNAMDPVDNFTPAQRDSLDDLIDLHGLPPRSVVRDTRFPLPKN